MWWQKGLKIGFWLLAVLVVSRGVLLTRYNPDEIYYVDKGVGVELILRGNWRNSLWHWGGNKKVDRSFFNPLVFGVWEKILIRKDLVSYLKERGIEQKNWFWGAYEAGKFQRLNMLAMIKHYGEVGKLILWGRVLAGGLSLLGLKLMMKRWGWWGGIGWWLLMSSKTYNPVMLMMTSDSFVWLLTILGAISFSELIVKIDWEKRRKEWVKVGLWLGMLFASKINGLLIGGWIGLVGLERAIAKNKLKEGIKVGILVGLMVWGVFEVSNPGVWQEPVRGTIALFRMRGAILKRQVNNWSGIILNGGLREFLGILFKWYGVGSLLKRGLGTMMAINLTLFGIGVWQWWKAKDRLWVEGLIAWGLILIQYWEIWVAKLSWERYMVQGILGVVFFEVLGISLLVRRIKR